MFLHVCYIVPFIVMVFDSKTKFELASLVVEMIACWCGINPTHAVRFERISNTVVIVTEQAQANLKSTFTVYPPAPTEVRGITLVVVVDHKLPEHVHILGVAAATSMSGAACT